MTGWIKRQRTISPELEQKIINGFRKMSHSRARSIQNRQDCLDMIDFYYLTLNLANRAGETLSLEYKNVNWGCTGRHWFD